MDADVIEAFHTEIPTSVEIEQMSPVREFYPTNMHTMEAVQFSPGFRGMELCAHDGFAFLAEQQIEDMRTVARLIRTRRTSLT